DFRIVPSPSTVDRLLDSSYHHSQIQRRRTRPPSRDSHLKGDMSKGSHRFCTDNYCVLLVSFALFTALFCAEVFAAGPLPPLHADLSETSISGVSSGGYMAVQFHVAYSSLVSGVGVIAGGPYNCADRSLWRATHHCMHPDPFNPVPEVHYL